ncbi:hypothetical protein AYO41_01775 [Verrucomicrobia bacterium SCGC AG-212-E04]|nr:hypothetical protein AYO41_01775 [Verrucomicrobia bacterium SCGC AG-212-E04]
MPWSGIVFEVETIKLTAHVNHPAPADFVVVAINSEAICVSDADASGLIRLYGSASEIASVRAWLQARNAQ